MCCPVFSMPHQTKDVNLPAETCQEQISCPERQHVMCPVLREAMEVPRNRTKLLREIHKPRFSVNRVVGSKANPREPQYTRDEILAYLQKYARR